MISSLRKLPPSPPGKTGWPWTVESNPLPLTMPDGQPWPKISIVTPSYNQGEYLEETIRSVFLQNYPNLEYIIMDGGSTDDSVLIIKKYEQFLNFWTSEPDRGQVNALNKGFEMATGSIFAWLNSDDIYLPDTLKKVGEFFLAHSEQSIIIGERLNITQDGCIINRQTISSWPVSLFHVLYMGRWPFYQESVFFTQELWGKAGKLSDKYNYLFDFDFFIRCLHFCSASTLPGILLGCWRHHDAQKIHPDREKGVEKEMTEIYAAYRNKYYPKWLYKILWSIGQRSVWKDDKTVTVSGNISSYSCDVANHNKRCLFR